MSKPESYLQHSIKVMQNLDMRALSGERRGQSLGRGSGFTMYHLGHISIDGSRLPVGLKQSHRSGAYDTISRLQRELAGIELITGRVVEARRYFPAFMGLIAVKGDPEAVAILTEDVSDNSRKKVFPRAVNDDMQARLARGFADIGTADEVLKDEPLRSSVAFDVDGRERWLDLTPTPLNLFSGVRDLFEDTFRTVRHAEDDLTRTIPADSALAESLTQRT